MDELLIQAGQDPLEGRLALMDYAPYRRVLEAVGVLSNWGSAMGPNQGRGVAFVESFGVPVAMVVEVTNTDTGIRIDRVFTTLDVGPVSGSAELRKSGSGRCRSGGLATR